MNITKYQNSVSFTTIDDPQIVKYELFEVFISKLEERKASSIKQEEDYILYKVNFFRFVSNWNLLNTISDGYIQFEITDHQIEVNYQIRFNDIFFISCFMAFASILAGYDIVAKIIIPILIFLIYYGLNVSICILRYKHFIKKTITEYLEKDISSLTKEQEEWIADDTKCDGCGATLKPSDKYCQNCGLLVRIDI